MGCSQGLVISLLSAGCIILGGLVCWSSPASPKSLLQKPKVPRPAITDQQFHHPAVGIPAHLNVSSPYELQDGDGRKLLGIGGDVKTRITIDGPLGVQVRQTGVFGIDDFTVQNDAEASARSAVGDVGQEDLVDSRDLLWGKCLRN